MDRACSTYGAKDKYVQDFWWGNLKDRGHLDGIIMSRWILKD